MVDISEKGMKIRYAEAETFIQMNTKTFNKVINQTYDKGDVLAVARIAGIMGAKKTAELIPLCHPLSLTHCEIKIHPDHTTQRVYVRSICQVTGKTGVEMEALIAASTAALTLYDMCKSSQKDMVISGLRLLHKRGGNSGDFEAL